MQDSIQLTSPAASGVVVTWYNPLTQQVWNTSLNGGAGGYEPESDANYSDYAVAASQQGTTGRYVVARPAGVAVPFSVVWRRVADGTLANDRVCGAGAQLLPDAAPATAGGLLTVGTGAGQIQPDGLSGAVRLAATEEQKRLRDVLGVAGTVWCVAATGSNADGLTWATARTSPSGPATAAGDLMLLAAGQTFPVGSSAVALADGAGLAGGGSAVVATVAGADALVTWGGAGVTIRDVTLDAGGLYSLPPLGPGDTGAAPTNARLERVRFRGNIDCLIFGGGDLVATDCDFRTAYAVDSHGRTPGQSGFAGDGGFADATNLTGGAVRFVRGLIRGDGKGYESTRALNAGAGAAVRAEGTILEAVNPPAGGNAYAVYAGGAGTTVDVTGGRVAGSPYDVFCGSGAAVTLTDVAGSGPGGAITVDPAGAGAVVTRGKSQTAAAAVASAVWGAASRTVTGATSPLPTSAAGTGPFALSHNGGTGAAGAPVTVGGSPAGPDRLRVVDAGGNGIAGATIRLYLASDTTLSNVLGAATTGPDGRWLGPIYCNSGGFQVVIACPGSQTDTEAVVVP